MQFLELFFTTLIPVALLALFTVVAALKTLYWVYLWQLKEYRSDRMTDFLSTLSGHHTTTNFWNVMEFLFVIIFTVVTFALPPTSIVGRICETGFAIYLGCAALKYGRSPLLPIMTIKAALLSGGVGFVVFGTAIILALWTATSLSLAILLVLIPLAVTAAVFVLQPISRMQKQRIINAAKAKIDHHRPIVIGVTGSYGKTSTKEFLKTILSERYTVLATPKNVNVDIGVAQVILDSLNDTHEVFIVEMGAYRPGEIASTCNLVSPMIGIITTIKEQHLALFGSREAITHAKAELYESLPPSGLAVVNRDNPLCMDVASRTDAKQKFFSTQDVAHVSASSIQVSQGEVQFLLHCGTEKLPVRVELHGQQVIPSILAAVVVADHLGMSLREIVRGIEKLTPIEGTMHLRSGKNHALVIDDHYNSNPDGFLAAIEYLRIFRERRKIIITPGMQELGSESDAHHRAVGSRAGEVADVLIITKGDFAKPLWDAAKSGGLQEERIIIEDRPQKLIALIEDFTPNDVILVEGRIYNRVYTELIQP